MEDRYARHHLLEGWDQSRLATGRVLVAGVGAVGNEVVKLLTLMGVGHLLLVDFDTVETSNLTRSVLFRSTDVGKSKAHVAALRAHDLNPDVEARWVQGHLEFDVGLGVYRAHDVVIGCLDSINARLSLNRACCKAGVSWINTGIEAAVAEVALFQSGMGACFECAMSESMWERRNQRFSCGGLHSDLPENAVPTTATVASLTAALAVNEALLLLHGRKSASSLADVSFSGLAFSQKLYITVAPYGMQIADLPANPHCLAHERWEPVRAVAQCASEISVSQLLHLADSEVKPHNDQSSQNELSEDELSEDELSEDELSEEGMEETLVELGYDLLTSMRCLHCDRHEEIMKPVEVCSLALNYCIHCNLPSRTPETVNWLDAHNPLAERFLADLGIPEHQILTLKKGNTRQYIQISGDYV